jgi:hypothetical protein
LRLAGNELIGSRAFRLKNRQVKIGQASLPAPLMRQNHAQPDLTEQPTRLARSLLSTTTGGLG